MLSTIVNFVEWFAMWGAGVASLFGSYEPQMPECLFKE